MADRSAIPFPPRKAAKEALRAAGYSCRQVDAFMRRGWRGLVDAVEAENEELKESLEELKTRLVGVK